VSTISYAQPSYSVLDPVVLSRACDARDSRFDGLFFVAITTTRIYCRPVCPARVSYPERRRFFTSAAAAEQAGYRPCLRCRPELAPGRAQIEIVSRLAARAAKRVAAGALNGHSVAELACEMGVSERHLRRAFERELGVSPVQLALTHRLLLAKRLLADTSLPVTRIAYASGFQSLRRFNAVFQEHYRMPPSALRRSRRARSTNGLAGSADLLRLTLAYRAPLAWDALTDWFAMDAIPGVDFVEDGRYGRSIELDGYRGVIFVQDSMMAENRVATLSAQERVPGNTHLDVDISLSLVPVLMPLLAHLRHLFDLDAEPTVIDSQLASAGLSELVMRHPGMRIPGAFSGFEVAFRTLLGGWPDAGREANELAQRVVEAIGEPNESGDPRLAWLLPTAERVANTGTPRLQALGVPHTRAEALVAIARGMVDGSLQLNAGGDPMEARRALLAIGGVSEQVATMIIMRALSWPDAFPISAGESASVVARAEKWRPWRAYALLHLWMNMDVRGVTDARHRAAS
jgi:AraC family transcriptional regulator, regulatory protein of adaptative response / DNA-3-methyladenine glycosylase II